MNAMNLVGRIFEVFKAIVDGLKNLIITSNHDHYILESLQSTTMSSYLNFIV